MACDVVAMSSGLVVDAESYATNGGFGGAQVRRLCSCPIFLFRHTKQSRGSETGASVYAIERLRVGRTESGSNGPGQSGETAPPGTAPDSLSSVGGGGMDSSTVIEGSASSSIFLTS